MSDLILGVIVAVNICGGLLLILWTVMSLVDSCDMDFDKQDMAKWNYFKWIAYGVEKIWNIFIAAATWKPKTGIDKEIADEEKEIAELERQKEKMDRLAELKRRKERLFRDLGEEQRMMCTCGREFHSIDNYKEHLTNCFES